MKKFRRLLHCWISFVGCPDKIYKVLDEDTKYVYVDNFWERKEFVEIIYHSPLKMEYYD